jgi:hypothetical protein
METARNGPWWCVISTVTAMVIERIRYQADSAKRMVLMIVIVQPAGANSSAPGSDVRTQIVVDGTDRKNTQQA